MAEVTLSDGSVALVDDTTARQLRERVEMLSVVQDSLSERNRECVELRERCGRLEAERDELKSAKLQHDTQQRAAALALHDERIERLEGALRESQDAFVTKCAENFKARQFLQFVVDDYHGYKPGQEPTPGLDCVQRIEIFLSSGLAAADGQPRSQDRTPERYAIEHGRYLATAARQFMDSCNAVWSAQQAVDEDETETQNQADWLLNRLSDAEESRSDHWRGLENAIYEFTKRADRAYPLSLAAADGRQQISSAYECPSDECPMCANEACNKCGAGCWAPIGSTNCEHDVTERHEQPSATGDGVEGE